MMEFHEAAYLLECEYGKSLTSTLVWFINQYGVREEAYVATQHYEAQRREALEVIYRTLRDTRERTLSKP